MTPTAWEIGNTHFRDNTFPMQTIGCVCSSTKFYRLKLLEEARPLIWPVAPILRYIQLLSTGCEAQDVLQSPLSTLIRTTGTGPWFHSKPELRDNQGI